MGEFVNSTQVRFDKSYVSCGVMEAHHLPKQSPSKTLFSIATAMYHKANPRPCAFVIFSDVVHNPGEELSRGEYLAAEILKQKNHGVFQETSKQINPRTGNAIKVWIWTVNHESMREWYKEELANRVDE